MGGRLCHQRDDAGTAHIFCRADCQYHWSELTTTWKYWDLHCDALRVRIIEGKPGVGGRNARYNKMSSQQLMSTDSEGAFFVRLYV